jgi:L-asparagine transporter-like permease
MYRKQKQNNKRTKFFVFCTFTPMFELVLYFVLLLFFLVFVFCTFTPMFEVVLYFVLLLFCLVFDFYLFTSMFEARKEQNTTPLQTLR